LLQQVVTYAQEEGEGDMRTDPIDSDEALCVSITNGGVMVDPDRGNYYLVRFTGFPMRQGKLRDEEASVTVAMMAEAASDLIRGLTESVSEHDPNILYDAGVVAAYVPLPPQAEE
jgi:hypothetical protein